MYVRTCSCVCTCTCTSNTYMYTHCNYYTYNVCCYSAVTSNMYADVTPVPEDGNCTLVIECFIEGVNEFWITVNQNGTAVFTRRLIDCNASAAMMVSMLPVEFGYEIEMTIGDVMVILLGTVEGNNFMTTGVIE